MDIVIFGLTITSSWGNGHATTYRSLVKGLAERGHRIRFCERDVPWYRDNRDRSDLPYCQVDLYATLDEVAARFSDAVRRADLVMLGSYVPEGVAIGEWLTTEANGITAFYDIDTPETLAKLARGNGIYISPSLIPRFGLYLSFAGGDSLPLIEQRYGSPRARALYCSVDPDLHAPVPCMTPQWDLGYLGTYSSDRQPTLERLLVEPARIRPDLRFVVAGPQYPASIEWPANVERIEHVAPRDHARFYSNQRYTLNVTRAEMAKAGFAPSVRLLEASACGVAIISDSWPGLEQFFAPGKELLSVTGPDDVIALLNTGDEDRRSEVAAAGRRATLERHTGRRRAVELETYCEEVVRARRERNSNGTGAAA